MVRWGSSRTLGTLVLVLVIGSCCASERTQERGYRTRPERRKGDQYYGQWRNRDVAGWRSGSYVYGDGSYHQRVDSYPSQRQRHSYSHQSPSTTSTTTAKPSGKTMEPEEMKKEKKECSKREASNGKCVRKERELKLPNGFMAAFETKVFFNLYDNDQMGRMRIQFRTEFLYRPPSDLVKSAKGRSLSSARMLMDKKIIYNTFKETFSKVGTDGEACLQRAICEVAEAPLKRDGILGELFNIILSPSHGLTMDDEASLERLVEAERHGRELGQCDLIYSSCPLSLFKAVDAAADYTGSVLDALSPHEDDD